MLDFSKYNIFTPEGLLDYFNKNMNYGFVYRGKVFTDNYPDFQTDMDKYYKLRIGEDFIKYKYGVCWDFCELERQFFISKGIEHECYFIESFITREQGGPTHTFCLYKDGNKWYWLEYAWAYHRDIHSYDSKEQALSDILNKFERFFNRKLTNINMYKTKPITKRLNTYEFVEECLHGRKVDILNLDKEKA